ncbi:MAG TPA: type II secretion system protein [Verrucomicrobiales bacterium]|jgi:prepilin-type N-terminal cleavage/methylation domain-containing protein|nr:type II secretion system protein [Verrucomicrobiales bacterium]
MNASRTQRKAPPAFTLVELMLSVAIVAVLTAAAIGAFYWARTRAAISTSSSNLHQLVVANLAYAADHGGYYCPAQEPRNLRRWHGSRASTEEEFTPEDGFLTPYLGKDKKLETCPLLLKTLGKKSSFEDGAGGYGYNATYIGGRPGDIYSPVASLDVEVPGRTIMFATTALSKEEGIQEYPFAEPWFAPTEKGGHAWDLQPSVHFRAEGKAIVAWCDGRISLEKPAGFKETNYYGGNNEKAGIGWFGPEASNGFWNPYSPAALNGWNPLPEEPPGQSGGESTSVSESAEENR